jgi:hypothetical protein
MFSSNLAYMNERKVRDLLDLPRGNGCLRLKIFKTAITGFPNPRQAMVLRILKIYP